jgi:inward rectifier potassium channel
MNLGFINNIIKRDLPHDEDEELGFGSAFDAATTRLINEDGHFNIERRGQSVKSMYLDLVNMSWPKFFLVIIVAYLAINAVFAFIFFWMGVEQITGIESVSPGKDFLNAFFFSIQTFTTVGYGHLSPSGLMTSFVASLDSFVGLLSFALATGLFFARFSKAEAHIEFSKHMLLAPYKGARSLQFRLVHLKDTKVVGLEARVILSWLEYDAEGKVRRKFHRLQLELDSIFLFPLNWTIVHKITESSPLYEKDAEAIKQKNAEVLVLVKGYDESYGKEIHASASYDCSQLIADAIFIPMYETTTEKTILHLDRINDIRLNNE